MAMVRAAMVNVQQSAPTANGNLDNNDLKGLDDNEAEDVSDEHRTLLASFQSARRDDVARLAAEWQAPRM